LAGMLRRWRKARQNASSWPSRGKLRRFMQFYDAAGSWSRVARIIIARVQPRPDPSYHTRRGGNG
jgi:hypothetical protein